MPRAQRFRGFHRFRNAGALIATASGGNGREHRLCHANQTAPPPPSPLSPLFHALRSPRDCGLPGASSAAAAPGHQILPCGGIHLGGTPPIPSRINPLCSSAAAVASAARVVRARRELLGSADGSGRRVLDAALCAALCGCILGTPLGAEMFRRQLSRLLSVPVPLHVQQLPQKAVSPPRKLGLSEEC